MSCKEEKLVKKRVAYTLHHEGKFYIVENVPARVNEETGEQFFAPETVDQLQKIILGRREARRFVETPVYVFGE